MAKEKSSKKFGKSGGASGENLTNKLIHSTMSLKMLPKGGKGMSGMSRKKG